MKISIITVCKNAQNTIEETINSVLTQTYSDIEYIIIDGKSTDNTGAIINKYRDKLAYFISESDNGLYDAMNKGIKASTGEVLYFLNADDLLYHSSIINNVIKHFNENYFDFLYGDILMLNKNNGQCHLKRHNNVNPAFLYANAIPQQAVFYRKEAFEKCGYFDSEYKIVGDREWLLRAFLKEKLQPKYIDVPVALFTQGGLSNNKKYDKIHSDERKRMKNLYYNSFGVSFTAWIPKPIKFLVMKCMNLR